MRATATPNWYKRYSSKPEHVDVSLYPVHYWDSPVVSICLSQPCKGLLRPKFGIDIAPAEARALAVRLLEFADMAERAAR